MKEVMYDSYMRGYSQVLDGMFLMHKYSAFNRTLEEFMHESQSVGQLNDNAQMISQGILFTGQLNKCLMAGTYKDGLWVAKNIDSYLKRYGDRLTLHEKMPLYFKVASLYFGDGNYTKCIENLSYIIAVKDHNIRRDLQCYARMLNLMALYDAGLDFNIDYQIRSVYSFIVKMKDMTEMKQFKEVGMRKPLVVRVYSFSYKKGIPADGSGNGGGFVFDCRAINNPGKYERYQFFTGMDKPVIDFLEEDGEILPFLEEAYQMVDFSVKRYMDRGFQNLMVSFGCTGGQHRSVYAAEKMAQHINEKYGVEVQLIHREQNMERVLNAKD